MNNIGKGPEGINSNVERKWHEIVWSLMYTVVERTHLGSLFLVKAKLKTHGGGIIWIRQKYEEKWRN